MPSLDKNSLARLGGLKALVCVATMIASAWTASAQSEPPVPAGSTVVTVNGQTIDADAVRRALARRGAEMFAPNRSQSAKEAAVEELVRVQVLALAAQQENLQDQPEVRDAIDQMLAARYWRQVEGRVQFERVTDEEVEAFYLQHAETFKEPLRVRGSVLTLRRVPNAADPADSADAAERAAALRTSALAGDEQTFEKLVRKHSEDPNTRRRGGDLGWVLEGSSVFRYPPEVIDALFALQAPGDLSEVVTSERGVHLVRLAQQQGGTSLPLSVAAGDIRRQLERERRTELLDREYAAIRSRFQVEIDHGLLKQIGPRDLSDAVRPPSFPVGDPKP